VKTKEEPEMKKLFALLMLIVLAAGSVCLAFADTTIQVDPDLKVNKPASTANNPVIEGEDPFTGLPASDEPFTPILLVLDNSETMYPHYGTSYADIMIQVPNQNMGNNKVLALFANEYPEMAGPCRSSRMVSLPLANLFNACFTAWGEPPFDAVNESNKKVNVKYWLKEWGYTKAHKWYDMLGHNNLKDSRKKTTYIRKIHDELIANNVEFEKRPFLFTDEPLTRGEAASTVSMEFFPASPSKVGNSNKASNCVFHYTEGVGYMRESLMKTKRDINYDRTNDEVLIFSNIIVIRAKYGYTSNYYYMKENFVGSGQADIFQNGHYIRGSWYRDDALGRIVIMDDEGNELKFQRGKSYFVINNEYLTITCK
jgi:hypothetical protein